MADRLNTQDSSGLETFTEPAQPLPSTPCHTDSPGLVPFTRHQPQLSRSRTRSPYSELHRRSVSLATSYRTHSLPAAINPSSIQSFIPRRQRPPGPLRSPASLNDLFRPVAEENRSTTSPLEIGVSEQGVSEVESGLELTPRSCPDRPTHISPALGLSYGANVPRRRRPASPLYQVTNAPFGSFSTPTSLHSSPLLYATKFNESYPTSLSSTSVSSTPSARSRSPSISSLETIPDTPGEEEEALEAERKAKIMSLTSTSDPISDNSKWNRGLDGPTPRAGAFFGAKDYHKRWSVCGAERRSDLDLETIWEV